jgi:hypothetical protein
MFKTILTMTAAVFCRHKLRNAAIATAALACTAAMPGIASAHERGGVRVDVVVPGRDYCEPAPRCETERVWVPAEYRTVCDRVWVEPVTTLRVERFDVPAQYGYRDVVYYDRYGYRHCERQQVLISAARCEERSVPVVVCPGHFEEQTHQVLVCDGHWESRETRVETYTDQPTSVIEAPHLRLQIPLPF